MKNKKSSISSIIKFEELSWKKIDEFDKEKTIIFLPIGPMEEHGPHLPVGTDYLTARHAASDAIRILNNEKKDLNYILFPAIPLGFCDFNTDFPGSISSNSKTIKNIIFDIGSNLARHEFKYLIICTYHMALGHLRGIYSAIDKLERKYDIRCYEPWSPYFYGGKIEKNEPKLGFDTSKEVHAGFRETSLMKYQYPYLLDESYKELQSIYRNLNSPKILIKKFKELGLKNGYVGSPARADTDYGRWFYGETVKTYVKAAKDLYNNKKLSELPKDIKNKMNLLFWK